MMRLVRPLGRFTISVTAHIGAASTKRCACPPSPRHHEASLRARLRCRPAIPSDAHRQEESAPHAGTLGTKPTWYFSEKHSSGVLCVPRIGHAADYKLVQQQPAGHAEAWPSIPLSPEDDSPLPETRMAYRN